MAGRIAAGRRALGVDHKALAAGADRIEAARKVLAAGVDHTEVDRRAAGADHKVVGPGVVGRKAAALANTEAGTWLLAPFQIWMLYLGIINKLKLGNLSIFVTLAHLGSHT